MAKTGKNLLDIKKKVGKSAFDIDEALKTLKEVAYAKFDESVELAVNLGVNPRHADQMIRGTIMMPHGTGKKVRVAVIASGEKAKEAEEAGADIFGGDDLVEKIQGGFLDFDACVATPDMMKSVGRLGKILGTRGMMPNPKSGTVTFEIATAVKQIKAGRLEFRVDKAGIIHCAIGKISFSEDQLKDNAIALVDQLLKMKPASVKGRYLKKVTVSSTQGPGLVIDIGSMNLR
jgi:large subunit ribosomal protein L1